MRLPRPGIRGRLAAAIVLVLLVATGAMYLAVYRGTGSELEKRTETDLEREVERLESRLSSGAVRTPEGYTKKARRLVRDESFGPSARVVAIEIEGGGVATNQPTLLGPGLEEHEAGDGGSHDGHEKAENAARILEAEPGLTTVDVDDVGEVKLLTSETTLPGGVGATVRVGQPLAPVDTALSGLSDTFLLVGLITLLAGAIASWLLASTIARPMRRMAAVAEGVDGGDLSARIPLEGTRDEARTLAESFNRMLDRLEDAFARQRAFIADASHDLRTPLTVIRGQIDVLARDADPTPEEVARVSEAVSRATTRMQRLVDDLLILARTDSEKGPSTERVELRPLLVAEAELAPGRRVEVGAVTSRPVEIDRDQMARALANLISNAVAHTEEDGGIEISAVEEGDRVSIRVDDDGPGVAPGDRDRIFDRFVRLDGSRSTDSGGSGLGLAIVKAIAEAHGGTVSCGSSPLGGARFELRLPAARGA
ncbi:MAG: HAMP domain-containing histidine kinase [Solirubrobacterales bacterium]|nr:HAMP domain-containing histidine kinase [Solirubrobacterales bacterium]